MSNKITEDDLGYIIDDATTKFRSRYMQELDKGTPVKTKELIVQVKCLVLGIIIEELREELEYNDDDIEYVIDEWNDIDLYETAKELEEQFKESNSPMKAYGLSEKDFYIEEESHAYIENSETGENTLRLGGPDRKGIRKKRSRRRIQRRRFLFGHRI